MQKKLDFSSFGAGKRTWTPTSMTLDPKSSASASSAIPAYMGWMMGFEPMTFRATIWRPNQLGHTHQTLSFFNACILYQFIKFLSILFLKIFYLYAMFVFTSMCMMFFFFFWMFYFFKFFFWQFFPTIFANSFYF